MQRVRAKRKGIAVLGAGREGPELWVRQGEMLLRRDGGEGLPERLHGGLTLSVGA